jgi:hypothetical protein
MPFFLLSLFLDFYYGPCLFLITSSVLFWSVLSVPSFFLSPFFLRLCKIHVWLFISSFHSFLSSYFLFVLFIHFFTYVSFLINHVHVSLAYILLWEEKRQLGRPRLRWEENVEMNITEIVLEGVNLIHVVQNRDQWRALVNTVMNLRFPHSRSISWLAERTRLSSFEGHEVTWS